MEVTGAAVQLVERRNPRDVPRGMPHAAPVTSAVVWGEWRATLGGYVHAAEALGATVRVVWANGVPGKWKEALSLSQAERRDRWNVWMASFTQDPEGKEFAAARAGCVPAAGV